MQPLSSEDESEEFLRIFGEEEKEDCIDRLIDNIDLENDDDVLEFLGVILDG